MHFPQGIDLNAATLLRPSPRHVGGDGHALRSVRVLASDGPSADESLSQMCPTLPRQSSHPILHLPRPVPMHGICAAHLPREPARYRSVSASSSRQALSHGHPWRDVAQHARQRQSAPGLAHLRRVRAGHDSHRSPPVCRREPGAGARQHRLRAGRFHRRPVPVGVSVGVVPLDQVRRQAAHVIGPAGQHSDVHTRLRREDARCERPRHPGPRARGVLHHGPRVRGLRAVVPSAHRRGVLHHPRQVQHALRAPVLSPGRQDDRGALRPDGGVGPARRVASTIHSRCGVSSTTMQQRKRRSIS